jgi:hypothetical protein
MPKIKHKEDGLNRFCQLSQGRRSIQACLPCKKMKQKCGDIRPCPRCVRNGRADACVSGQDDMLVERPLSWTTHFIHFQGQRPFPVIKPKLQWARKTIFKIWAAGYEVHGLERILDSLPPKLAFSAANALEMLQTKSNQHTYSLASVTRSIGIDGTVSDDDSTCMERLAQDAEMWEAQTEYGFWQFTLDPVTQERRSLFINSRFAEQCGFHKEEMLARLANYEAEVPRPDIDTLRVFLDNFNHLLDDSRDAPIERWVELSGIFTEHSLGMGLNTAHTCSNITQPHACVNACSHHRSGQHECTLFVSRLSEDNVARRKECRFTKRRRALSGSQDRYRVLPCNITPTDGPHVCVFVTDRPNAGVPRRFFQLHLQVLTMSEAMRAGTDRSPSQITAMTACMHIRCACMRACVLARRYFRVYLPCPALAWTLSSKTYNSLGQCVKVWP